MAKKKRKNTDISAMMSDHVVVEEFRNQWVISALKEPKKSDTPLQHNNRGNFRDASKWAHSMMKKPDMKALYSKGITDKMTNAELVARTDYLVAPTIHYISLKDHKGAIGDAIRIKATDNFQVTSVDVVISSKKGNILERGPAVRYKRKPKMWLYTLTVANGNEEGTVIVVTAEDRPGNKVVKTETLEKSEGKGRK